MTKATEQELAELHGAIARGLTDIVNDGVVVGTREDGEFIRATAPAAFFMAGITLLKNNSITADAAKNGELQTLNAALAKRRAESKAKLISRGNVDELIAGLERDLGGQLPE